LTSKEEISGLINHLIGLISQPHQDEAGVLGQVTSVMYEWGPSLSRLLKSKIVQVKIVQMKIVKVKTDQVRKIEDTSGFVAKLSLEFFFG